jgi:hypothetical protein
MIYVLSFESGIWPEFNGVLGVYSTKDLAIAARRRAIERHKNKPRTMHVRNELNYLIQDFDIDENIS